MEMLLGLLFISLSCSGIPEELALYVTNLQLSWAVCRLHLESGTKLVVLFLSKALMLKYFQLSLTSSFIISNLMSRSTQNIWHTKLRPFFVMIGSTRISTIIVCIRILTFTQGIMI